MRTLLAQAKAGSASAEDVESILTTNPAAVLSFAAPQPEAMVLKQTSKL